MKKPASKQSDAAMPQHFEASISTGEKSSVLHTFLWMIPFFLVSLLSVPELIKQVILILSVLVAVLYIWKGSRLRNRCNLQFAVLLCYVLLAGISTFYAMSGLIALVEYAKILAAFLCYLLIVLLERTGPAAGRNAATALSVSAALYSLLSLDLISLRWLSGPLMNLMSRYTTAYNHENTVEVGTRILSILDDPNVFAGVAGIGILMALGLAVSSRGKWRMVHIVCLSISSLAFLLTLSLGAVGFLAVAFLCYLIFLPKTARVGAAILMVEALIVTVVCAIICYATVFGESNPHSIVPVLVMAAGAAALTVLDHAFNQKLSSLLEANRKRACMVLGALVLLAIVYMAAGWNLTGSAVLTAGTPLNRAAYLNPGEYSCSVDAAGDVCVTITSQSENELCMRTSTELYTGSADGVSFTVPDDSKVVWFAFSSDSDTQLNQFAYTGAESGTVKLNYTLLPGFVANRLQGLRANQNAAQRTVFWKDGMKLLRNGSVFFGRGLGAFETAFTSVQDYFYITKYLHNQYLQVLLDTGALGLLLFLGVLASSAWLLLREKKRETASPLLPALGSALIFMLLQALIQVDFSSSVFLCFAYGVFALTDVCCSHTAEQENSAVKAHHPLPLALRVGSVALLAVWFLLLAGNLKGLSIMSQASGFQFFADDQKAMAYDKFNRLTYLQSYVYNAPQTDNSGVTGTAKAYAAELESCVSNVEPCYVAEYYFETGNLEKGRSTLADHVEFNRSRADCWQYAFTLLAAYDDGSDAYHADVLALYQHLQDLNGQRLEILNLTDENMRYLSSLQ